MEQATNQKINREAIAWIAFLVRHAERFGRYEDDLPFQYAAEEWGEKDNPVMGLRAKAYADADHILALIRKGYRPPSGPK